MKSEGYFANRYDAESPIKESGVMTCAHCSTVLYLHAVPGKPLWREEGGWCRRESKPLCGPCAEKMLTHGCTPALAEIERYGESLVRYEQYLKLAGLEPAPVPKTIIQPGEV